MSVQKDKFKEWFFKHYESSKTQTTRVFNIKLVYEDYTTGYTPVDTYLEWFREWGFKVNVLESTVYAKHLHLGVGKYFNAQG